MANLFKFYFDFVSPVSRPLWILFEHANVKCEKIQIALRKGEHLTEAYARDVNRFKKVPAIEENGFILTESVAIFHHLGRRGIIPERWYPSDLKKRTRIDEFLEWQHTNIGIGAGSLFHLHKLINGSEEDIKYQEKILNKNLFDLDIWLKNSKFLTGDEITFADLMGATAIEQVEGMKLFTVDPLRYPKVNKWREAVQQSFSPKFQEAHRFVYKYGNAPAKQ